MSEKLSAFCVSEAAKQYFPADSRGVFAAVRARGKRLVAHKLLSM
jgi:hypothetical protein